MVERAIATLPFNYLDGYTFTKIRIEHTRNNYYKEINKYSVLNMQSARFGLGGIVDCDCIYYKSRDEIYRNFILI